MSKLFFEMTNAYAYPYAPAWDDKGPHTPITTISPLASTDLLTALGYYDRSSDGKPDNRPTR